MSVRQFSNFATPIVNCMPFDRSNRDVELCIICISMEFYTMLFISIPKGRQLIRESREPNTDRIISCDAKNESSI